MRQESCIQLHNRQTALLQSVTRNCKVKEAAFDMWLSKLINDSTYMKYHPYVSGFAQHTLHLTVSVYAGNEYKQTEKQIAHCLT